MFDQVSAAILNVVNVRRPTLKCRLVPSSILPCSSLYRLILLLLLVLYYTFEYSKSIVWMREQLPAVLTAVVNVVNGSFRADAASSLIVTRGFMGNLPVNFSTEETQLYKVQVVSL